MPNGIHFSDEPISLDGTLQRGVQQAGESLHSTIDRVVDPVYGAVGQVSRRAHESVDKVASTVHAAAERLDAQTQRVRALPSEAAEQLRDVVRARPLKAVAAALALGWLFGRLGARR